MWEAEAQAGDILSQYPGARPSRDAAQSSAVPLGIGHGSLRPTPESPGSPVRLDVTAGPSPPLGVRRAEAPGSGEACGWGL